MLINYRRTGGPLAVLAFAAIALVAMLTAAVAAVVLMVGLLIAAAVSLARAVLPRSWRHGTVPPAATWPYDTLEGTVVDAVTTHDD